MKIENAKHEIYEIHTYIHTYKTLLFINTEVIVQLPNANYTHFNL